MVTRNPDWAEAERQMFVSLAEQSTEFIGICDMDFMPFFVNDAGREIVGLDSLEQALHTPVKEFFFPEDQQFIYEDFFPRVLSEGRAEVEIRFRHFKTGQALWMMYNVFHVLDPQGNPIGLATVSRNITDRKKIEEKLREADHHKNEFLAILAHELRNPLTPIRNAVAILKHNNSSSLTMKAAQDLIDQQLHHMVRLIDDLMDVNRISRGKLQLRKEYVDLATILEQVLDAARPTVEQAGHELRVSLTQQHIYLNADSVRLTQVFLNLLNNACKYTNRGGNIELTVEQDDADVVVKITDTGIGIPAEYLPGLFELFSQVPSNSEQAEGGLGIGLSLSKALIDMHGGAIEVKSEGPGRGSEFSVRLPALNKTHTPQFVRSQKNDELTPVALRILVADDNLDVVKSLVMLLEVFGYDVLTANDGLQAIEAAAHFRPDVVLLDIGMPKLDGYGACRHIRERPWGKDIKIYALSGLGRDDDLGKSRASGFTDHLVKPVDPELLLRLLADQRDSLQTI